MDEKLFGETIRIEAASRESLTALAVAAIGAFARAAGGEPAVGDPLENAVQEALAADGEQGPRALSLMFVEGAVELRDADRPHADPVLVWSA